MIRFTYSHGLDPERLHNLFLQAGAAPSLYVYRPRGDVWTLTASDLEEAARIQDTLEALGIEFREQVMVVEQCRRG